MKGGSRKAGAFRGRMLSVVVPAYNEGGKMGRCIRRVAAFFRRAGRPFELLVVDDGSTDGTRREALEAARRVREVRVISYARNRGKGFAVRTGVLAARGDPVLFLDADLSTEPGEWPKLESALARGADIAIGSRKMRGARLVKRQPWWREAMGKVFTSLVRLLLVRVSDVTCGFKGMRRSAAGALFSVQLLEDWSFDAEVLFLAGRAGLRIAEVPVVWKDNPRSKVRPVYDAMQSALNIARIRWNAVAGKYAGLKRAFVSSRGVGDDIRMRRKGR